MSIRSAFSLFVGLFLVAQAGKADDLGESLSNRVRALFHEYAEAVVRVEGYDRHGKVCGTGFFTDPAGTIYTLSAIVANAEEIWVVQGQRKLPAKLLVADSRSGIALIKVEASSAFIPIGTMKSLELATPVLSIGFPTDRDATPTFGIIGGFDRQLMGKFLMTTHIRANLPVQAGFGGAPLLNLDGAVVGILIGDVDYGAAYAVPIDAAEKIRTNYARFGEPNHGWVGVMVEDAGTPEQGSRAKVSALSPGAPAEESGIQSGDILLQIGKFTITTPDDVIDASFFLTAGDSTSVTVWRDGEKKTLTMRAIRHPLTATSGLAKDDGIKDLRMPPGTPEMQMLRP